MCIRDRSTAALIATALPLLDRVSGERVRNEIALSLNEANPVLVMERLDEVGVMAQFHPGLSWRPETAAIYERIPTLAGDPLWGEVYRSSPPKFYYFAAWLAPFAAPIPAAVAERLRVRKATMTDLLALDDLQQALAEMPADAPVSRVARALAKFAPRTLLTARLLGLGPRADEWLDRYVGDWRAIKTGITGEDLRRAGVPPGPVYTRVLERLWLARLDGETGDEASERALLASLLAAEGY